MSSKATGLVWESDLPRPEKYVLLALADHAKEDGTDVYPSVSRVEWKTGYSETQVRDIMSSLRRKRILILVHKGGKGDKDTNKYRIDFKAIRLLPEFAGWLDKKRGTKPEGAKTEPSEGTKTAPCEGTVSNGRGYGFAGSEGTKIAPEPRTTRTVNLEQDLGNGASPLPPTPDLFPNQAPASARMNKPDAEQDPREPFVLKTIRGQWPKNCKCDIDNADMAAIRRMLRNRHRWNEAELALCIVARFLSDEYVDQGESVKAWIGAITDYQTGPKDKFGHPVYAGADLDRWREQARVILYGRQPVQAKIPEPTPEQIRAAFVSKVGGDVNGRCTEAFASLQQNFIRKLSPHSYETWVRPLRPLCLSRERVLYVLLPLAEFRHVGSKYGEEIKAWIGSGDTVAQVEFVTLEELR